MSGGEFVFNEVSVAEMTRRPDRTDVRALTPPECDFCLDRRVRWSYDCGPFVLPEVGFASDDGWAACDRCADMIERGDREALALRSIRSWKLRGQPAHPLVFESIRAIQAGFLEHQRERRAFG